MDASASRWLGPIAVALGALAYWVVLCHAIAALAGWRALARAYPARGLGGGGERIRFAAAQLRWLTGYNGCLTFEAGPMALRVSVWPLFRAGHPPFEVPWSEITARREPRHSRLVGARATLRFARTPGVPLRVTQRLAERLAAASGGQLHLLDPPADSGAGR
jgi:hypothetical protein